MDKKKEKLNLIEPAEKAFIVELSDRLKYIKSYFDDRYKPLKAEFQVNKMETRPYIMVRFRLIGEKMWSVGTEMNISDQFNVAFGGSEHIVRKYTEAIQYNIEEAVRQEGIKSINS